MLNYEKHKINVPYIIRYVWGSGTSKEAWDKKIFKARDFLLNDFPQLIVDSGLAKFAPTNNVKLKLKKIGRVFIANHYYSRWNSNEKDIQNMGNSQFCNIYGVRESEDFVERWDILRDLWQESLAPQCCKDAYFNSKLNDPYIELYGDGEALKKIEVSSTNSLLAPIGLFMSPIVPCSLNCVHAQAKAIEIEKLVKDFDLEIYETLKTVVEMPIKVDTYRGIAIIDTPMFKATYGTDALRDKKILKVKSKNTEFFDYSNNWVVKGSVFPYKGIFS